MMSRLIVTKVGGAGLGDPGFLDALTRNTVEVVRRGDRALIVHGGGPDIASLHDRLGIPFEVRQGLRVTRDESIDLVVMALCGLLNKRIVARFLREGIRAVGVSGIDGGTLRAPFLDRDTLGDVGGDPEVHPEFLLRILEHHYVPVVAPVAIGPEGTAVNVNADVAAQAIAIALGAATLDFVTDAPGVLEEDAVIRVLRPENTESLIASGVVQGGMVPKIRAARAALESGVDRVRVGNLESLAAGTATEAALI
jgi:acetylglutamate kinase